MQQTFKFARATNNFVRYEVAFGEGGINGKLYVPITEFQANTYPPEVVVTITVPKAVVPPTKAAIKKAPVPTKKLPAQKTATRRKPAAS